MFEPSLVQYDKAELISKKSEKVALEENRKKADEMILMNIEELMDESGVDVLDMLDVLIPPRIIEEEGKIWCQKVSRSPATLSDLNNLEEAFNNEFIRQEGREIGLCDIRRTLFDQLFDELIRQEIIVCPQRGRLLRMIRRETALSLTSLLGCYESSLAYGINKKLSACAEKVKLTRQITELQSNISELNEVIRELEPKVAEIKKTTEDEEAKKVAELDAVESEIIKENDSQLAFLMGCFKVNIELEA